MLKLSTHIPLEYIKQSSKLRKIKCLKYYKVPNNKCRNSSEIRLVETKYTSRRFYFFQAPTIADIIDNGFELFAEGDWGYSSRILEKCMQDDSIEEISEYIIKNIK